MPYFASVSAVAACTVAAMPHVLGDHDRQAHAAVTLVRGQVVAVQLAADDVPGARQDGSDAEAHPATVARSRDRLHPDSVRHPNVQVAVFLWLNRAPRKARAGGEGTYQAPGI